MESRTTYGSAHETIQKLDHLGAKRILLLSAVLLVISSWKKRFLSSC